MGRGHIVAAFHAACFTRNSAVCAICNDVADLLKSLSLSVKLCGYKSVTRVPKIGALWLRPFGWGACLTREKHTPSSRGLPCRIRSLLVKGAERTFEYL